VKDVTAIISAQDVRIIQITLNILINVIALKVSYITIKLENVKNSNVVNYVFLVMRTKNVLNALRTPIWTLIIIDAYVDTDIT